MYVVSIREKQGSNVVKADGLTRQAAMDLYDSAVKAGLVVTMRNRS